VRGDAALGPHDKRAWAALWALLAQTGMRKAEIALPPGEKFALKHFSWDNISWRIGGKPHARLTQELFAQLSSGDTMIVRPPPSKADPFGLRWGVRPIFLPYSASAPICAAREMAKLEIECVLADRRNTQVFALTGGPLRKANVDDHFKKWVCLPFVAGPAEAKRYSVHSFRSYLATALAQQGASTARIQAMLRWASDEAVLIYNRTTVDEYSQWIRAAACADIDTILTHNLPRAEARLDGARAADITYDSDALVAEMLARGEMEGLEAEAEKEDRGGG
jgi:integrase